jgi:branched-chain amino acid transport system ATP-binding protein
MNGTLLAVDKLEVVYHRAITAIQGVSLAVKQGQIVAILGSNGAGKSTTLRAISGFLGIDDARVTDGSISHKGERIENRLPNEIARRGIVLVPERDKVFPNLTVAENLSVPFARRRAARAGEDVVFRFFPRLRDLRGRTAGLLSGGERQMLAIGSALMCDPEVLLVDELSLGLAPLAVAELMEQVAQIRRELGLTIVIVEQSAAAALAVADHGYVLENGRVVLDGDAARLRQHGDIKEFYLGQAGNAERRSYRAVKQYRRTRRWYG